METESTQSQDAAVEPGQLYLTNRDPDDESHAAEPDDESERIAA
jgi:hypothetical protein